MACKVAYTDNEAFVERVDTGRRFREQPHRVPSNGYKLSGQLNTITLSKLVLTTSMMYRNATWSASKAR